MDSQWTPESSKSDYKGQNPLGLKSLLCHWKDFEMYMSKMGSHDPFEHLKHKLWQKKRAKSQIDNLTPDH
jgi:hypothetical protein